MTTADEILDAMQEEESEIGVLVIDNNLRTITIPPSMTILGVEGDDDVHRVKFRMPRYYGEFDLSGFGVRINYQNANKEEDAYIVEDKEADDAHITFSWLVGRNALRYKGAVKFSVCMRLLEDGLVVREFNTTTASLPSLEGLETDLSEGEEEQARDLAEQIKVQIRAAGDGQMVAVKETGMQQVADVKAEGTEQVKSIEEKGAATLGSIPADYTALSEGVSSLTEHKASAIIDISARAASHELYAQRESPIRVRMYGATYQEGTGDPSPDNVRPISGVDVASVHVGGETLSNTADLPLLPDGAPLMGDGTADDTIENDVLSGCDAKVVFDGSEDEDWIVQNTALTVLNSPYGTSNIVNGSTLSNLLTPYTRTEGVSWPNQPLNSVYGNKYGVGVKIDGVTNVGATDDENIANLRTYLAANPLTVYYRSTDYTPDKQLTTARTVRRWRTVKLADLTWKLNGTNMEGLPVYYASLSPVPRDEGENRMVCNVLPAVRIYHNATPCIYIDTTYGSRVWVVAKADIADASELTAWLTDAAFAVYQLATAETYATDPLPLYKPAAIESDTVTVTGSGETEVEYAHDTKHYIDSKISELVTLALANN